MEGDRFKVRYPEDEVIDLQTVPTGYISRRADAELYDEVKRKREEEAARIEKLNKYLKRKGELKNGKVT